MSREIQKVIGYPRVQVKIGTTLNNSGNHRIEIIGIELSFI